MNLIEQYGGYENLKSEYLAAKSMDFRAGVLNAFEKALLEYRRANNIFEIGDAVVYSSRIASKSLKYIETLSPVMGKPRTLRSGKSGFGRLPVSGEIRHATDSEIKAGHRL